MPLLGISSGAEAAETKKSPFVSCSSGAMLSDRTVYGDVYLNQIYVRFASL
jgi:hypothetical protein